VKAISSNNVKAVFPVDVKFFEGAFRQITFAFVSGNESQLYNTLEANIKKLELKELFVKY